MTASRLVALMLFVLACLPAVAKADPPQPSLRASDTGARGDDEADDTLAIQQALDRLPAAGGALEIPKGRFLISSPLTLRSNVRIWGGGTLIATRSLPNGMLQGTRVTNVTLEGLTLKMVAPLSPVPGQMPPVNRCLAFAQSHDLVLHRLVIEDFWYYGATFRDCDRVEVLDCAIRGIGNRDTKAVLSKGVPTGNPANWVGDALSFFGTATHVVVQRNEVANNGRHGIVFYPDAPLPAKRDVTIEANQCHDNGDIGILCNQVSEFQIRHNRCERNGHNGGPFGGQGIQLVGSVGGLVDDNTCTDNQEHGIQGGSATQVIVRRNLCTGNTWSGIDFDHGASDDLMIDNQCDGNRWGIRIQDGSRVHLTGNRCRNNQEDGILLRDTTLFSLLGNASLANGQSVKNRADIGLVSSSQGLVSQNTVSASARPAHFPLRVYASREILLGSNRREDGSAAIATIDGNSERVFTMGATASAGVPPATP